MDAGTSRLLSQGITSGLQLFNNFLSRRRAVRNISYNDGLGMQVTSNRGRRNLSSNVTWDAVTQATIDASKQGRLDYLNWKPLEQGVLDAQTNRLTDELYRLAAGDLTKQLEQEASQVRSNLNQRLGGSLTSSFGALNLAELATQAGLQHGQLRLRSRNQASQEVMENAKLQQQWQQDRINTINEMLSSFERRSREAIEQSQRLIMNQR